jgi:hypothetical protein
MFPRRAVASVVGIGGFTGSVSGMMIATATGYRLGWAGSYVPVFFGAASAYLIALAVIHLLAPDLQPARLQEDPRQALTQTILAGRGSLGTLRDRAARSGSPRSVDSSFTPIRLKTNRDRSWNRTITSEMKGGEPC